jgi:pentatricopeptide repeat protein
MGYLAEVEAFAAVSEAQLSASEWAAAVDAVSHSRGSAAAMFNAVLSALALRRNAEAALDVLKRMQVGGSRIAESVGG